MISELTYGRLMIELNYEFYDHVARYDRSDRIATFKMYDHDEGQARIDTFCGFPLMDLYVYQDADSFVQNRIGLRRTYKVPRDSVFYHAKLTTEFIEDISDIDGLVKSIFNCERYEIWRSKETETTGLLNVFYLSEK